jgi:hypothetical protein
MMLARLTCAANVRTGLNVTPPYSTHKKNPRTDIVSKLNLRFAGSSFEQYRTNEQQQQQQQTPITKYDSGLQRSISILMFGRNVSPPSSGPKSMPSMKPTVASFIFWASNWGRYVTSKRRRCYIEIHGVTTSNIARFIITAKNLNSNMAVGIRCPQKLAITSLTSGGRSVGIVRSRTKGHKAFFFITTLWLHIHEPDR